MKTPEGYEKDDIDNFLKTLEPDIWFFRPFMAGYGKSGISDFVGCYKGTFFSIEVKRWGKGPTELQRNRMNAVIAAGGYAFAGTADMVIPRFKSEFDL